MVMTMILTQLMAKSSGLKQNAFYHTCTEARRFKHYPRLSGFICGSYLNFRVRRPLKSRGYPTCVPLKTDSKL